MELWRMGYDWQRMYQQWMFNAISQVDLDLVEKVVPRWLTNLHNVREHLAPQPGRQALRIRRQV
jgi:hypothetical protein